MFAANVNRQQPKPALYAEVASNLRALIAGERDWIANLANASALLFDSLPDLNWAGFYLFKESELVVGPFQGKPACVRIAIGKGVCGTAAMHRETIVVPDVNAFEGHIACDSASNSEIVVPMILPLPLRERGKDGMGARQDGELIGVLDLDSPKLARFDAEDRDGLEKFVAILLENTVS